MPSGGKRPGAGRPKSDPTQTVTFRVNAESLTKAKKIHGRKLNKKINDYIARLAKKQKSPVKSDRGFNLYPMNPQR